MSLIHVMCVPSISHSKQVTWKGRGREGGRKRGGGRERGIAIAMQAIDTKRDVAYTFFYVCMVLSHFCFICTHCNFFLLK